MKTVVVSLALLCCTVISFGQTATQVWSVPSFIQPCTDSNKYRYIYPGQLSFDSIGNIVWLMRDRSTCTSPYNNFTTLNVTPAGSPLLQTFKKYDTPGDSYSYYEQITVHGKYAYWVGSSYMRDTAKSLLIAAIDLALNDTIWVKQWTPVGRTNYTAVSVAATDDGVYVTANAMSTFGEPANLYGYAMILGKWDIYGNQKWQKIAMQPFSQQFRGNIIANDSMVYSCGFRYSDQIPLYRGQGFIGAYRASDGELVDSFYFMKKRALSEYDPVMLASNGGQIVAIGTNPTQADAATFVANFSLTLDSLSFTERITPPYYNYFAAAAMDEKGFLYVATNNYSAPSYHRTIDVVDCRNEASYTVHRAVLLDPEPLSIAYMLASKGSLYFSMTANDADTTLIGFNRQNAFLGKYDVVALGVRNSYDVKNAELEVYPNPVATQATFITKTDVVNGELRITDAIGRDVRMYYGLIGNTFVVNRNELVSGIYFYTLRENGRVVGSGKMMVQ